MSNPSGQPGVRRREFLKVLGVGSAAAATVGCGTDYVEKLIPYVHSPDQTVPGVSTYYATTCRECAAACGVLAEVRDGRVIKLEGNPDHPLSRGALCARGQAAVQGLYNPDRFRGPQIRADNALRAASWNDALTLFRQRLGEVRSRGQAGGVVFINQHESGSFATFLDSWLAGFGFPAHISYDAEAHLATMEANRASFGVAWPGLRFSAARLIVSFGADFLDNWGASVAQQLDFADARARLQGAPRFIYVGARRSLTGLNADEWVPCRPGTEHLVAQALSGAAPAASVAQQSGAPAEQLTRLAREIAAARPALFLAGGEGANALELAQTVNRMNQAAGAVGTTLLPNEPVTSFEGMGGYGDLVDVVRRMEAGQVSMLLVRGANPAFSHPGFAAAMAKVPFKVSFSSFPDETAMLSDVVLPDDHALERWGDAQPVRGTISLQQPAMDRIFDTRATADVLIEAAKGDPSTAARYAGTGDYRTWLFGRIPGGANAVAAALPKGVMTGTLPNAPTPRRAPARVTAPAGEGEYFLLTYWSPTLGDGRGANKPWLQELPDPVSKIVWQSWVEVHPLTAKALGVGNGDFLEVTASGHTVTLPVFQFLGVRPDTIAIPLGQGHTAYGRYAKDVGVNAMPLLPAATDAAGGMVMATRARIRATGDHQRLATTEGSARQHGRGIAQALNASGLGLAVAPGGEHADEVAPRSSGGIDVARGTQPQGADTPRDINAGGERAAEHGAGQAGAGGAEHGGEHAFPGDASHEFLPGLRSPVANDAQGDLGDPASKDAGMYDPNHWSGMARRRWAMTIDLARCTGCSACITACYAENNIPTVGAPHQGRALGPTTPSAGPWDTRPGANVVKGREMTWIRVERYYEGGEGNERSFNPDFETRFAPMLCQHCGNAPCEPVCPVYATYHSPDGLNVQVYNRCVGTRYCSNGCPYKVRYFNWFGFGEPNRRQYAFPEPLNWQLNPDVTVRGKGVMEKCTFCVQRIREAESRARLEGRPVQPDEFTVACAQACPSRAITFGDAADPNWSIARLAQDRRAYHVFEELNTYTAVVYLKKVNHPSPGATTAAPAATTGEAH
ncbi:MAG TPA: 4Fe-4S dicluster domain-containing protein [Gemmatimonadaceae bacterium]|nr:4Fe-4S dicluster domain-containing protein [Gemmatimonadaceae bacterium]